MATRRGSGEGSVYQRSDGKWCAVVDLGWEDGKRKRKVLYGRTRAEAFDKLKKAQRQADTGTLTTGKVPTVEAWFASWLEAHSHNVAAGTIRTYRDVADAYVLPSVGKKRLDKVVPSDFTAMTSAIRKKGLSARTAQSAHKLLSQGLKAAVRQGVLGKNPADVIDAPTLQQKPVASLSEAEARKLLAAAEGDHQRFGALWILGLTTGLREGEILALRWADIDLEIGLIHVRAGKTAKARRTVPLAKVAAAALGEAGPGDALVFPSNAGTQIDRRNLLRAWHDFSLEVLGRRTPFHALRHSAATLWLAQGVDLKVISALLGHSGYSITADVYTEVVSALKADAAARMDQLLAGNQPKKRGRKKAA